MKKIIECRPQWENNAFLIACVLMTIDVLISAWGWVEQPSLLRGLLVMAALATCVLYVLAYLDKCGLFVAYIALLFRFLLEIPLSREPFHMLLYMACLLACGVAGYSVLGSLRKQRFFGWVERWKCTKLLRKHGHFKTNGACMFSAFLFAFLGVLLLIRWLFRMGEALSLLHLLDTLCLFGGVVLGLLATEEFSLKPEDGFMEYVREMEEAEGDIDEEAWISEEAMVSMPEEALGIFPEVIGLEDESDRWTEEDSDVTETVPEGMEILDLIERMDGMCKAGILTEEEFEEKKRELLGRL